MKLIIFISFLLLNVVAFAQSNSVNESSSKEEILYYDSLPKVKTKTLKKGIYDTYNDYLLNSPSSDQEFTIKRMEASKWLLIMAKIEFDGKRPRNI